MYDFAIGLCSYGGIKDVFFDSMMMLSGELSYKVYHRKRDALIGRSRSVVATQFLNEYEDGCLVFLDTDIIFKTQYISSLVENCQEYKIIAGAYMMSNLKPAMRSWTENLEPDGNIHEVEYASTGFMAIDWEVFREVRDKLKLPLLHEGTSCECYPFFESGRSKVHPTFYISEDWDFCDKAREVGYKVYWHSGIQVSHIKELVLTIGEDEKGYTWPVTPTKFKGE